MTARKSQAPPLSLEVYDRRFKIYRAAIDFIAEIVREGSVDVHRALKFAADTDEALFLFGTDLSEYLREIYKKAVRIHTLTALHKSASDDERRLAHSAKLGELLAWFSEQFEEVRAHITPFMRVG